MTKVAIKNENITSFGGILSQEKMLRN